MVGEIDKERKKDEEREKAREEYTKKAREFGYIRKKRKELRKVGREL